MTASETRKPRPSAANTGSRAHIESGKRNSTTIVREIAAILAIGLMTGVMFWQSVFGMADDLRGPMVPVSMAVEAHDYGR